MRDGNRRDPGGGGKLGDALSSDARAKLAKLRAGLKRKVDATVELQLKKPRPKWQRENDTARRAVGGRGQSPRAPANVRPSRRTEVDHVIPQIRYVPRRAGEAKGDVLEEPPFEYWPTPLEATAREAPPSLIEPGNLEEFQAILGASIDERHSGEGLHAIIGLDFGTSSTKVTVRFPYLPGEPVVAIPAPSHCRTEGNKYLWRSVLWIRAGGEFIAWPEAGAEPLQQLKQGLLADGSADTASAARSVKDQTFTDADAAVAFLSYVIRYAQGWLIVNRPRYFKGRRPFWFVSVGLPTSDYDDKSLVPKYRRVVAAAFLLASSGESMISVEATSTFLADSRVRALVSAGKEGRELGYELGIAVIPETVAEAHGFATSTKRARGIYFMVDIGAMTLDVCAFRLFELERGSARWSLLSAQVRPLGVEAAHWFFENGKSEPEFMEQAERMLHEVVWVTRKDRTDRTRPPWTKDSALNVILAGGGAANRLHQDVVEALGPWLKKLTKNNGISLLQLPSPNNIDLPVPIEDFGRLAVASGLSYAPTDIGAILAPSDIPDLPPRRQTDWSGRFISKDQV